MQIKWRILNSAFDTKITQCEHVSKKKRKKKIYDYFSTKFGTRNLNILQNVGKMWNIFEGISLARAVARIEKINKKIVRP